MATDIVVIIRHRLKLSCMIGRETANCGVGARAQQEIGHEFADRDLKRTNRVLLATKMVTRPGVRQHTSFRADT